MTATPPRRAALAVLRALRRGELLDRAFAAATDSLVDRDRAWARELVYGTVRLRGRLDHALAPHVRRGLGGLEADVLDVLRLGAYQLLEMDSVPAYAAVSEAVDLAREAAGRPASGLVNGVLKALDRGRDAIAFPDPAADPVGSLAARGSHPRWLLERWIGRYGIDAARALVAANDRRPELFLRSLALPAAAAVEALAAAGLPAQPLPIAPAAVRLGEGASIDAALAVLPAIVQDPAAGLVVDFADPGARARVVDLCAAPGGKALALAARGLDVVAVDVAFERLAPLRENVARLRAGPGADGPLSGCVRVVAGDARRPPVRSAGTVLVDAPCTGTGTLRRHPDGKWRLRPRDVDALARLQRAILAAAAELVPAGGLLVYATCSLETEENEGQVEAFLDANPAFRREPGGGVDAALLDERGDLRVLPWVHGVDGAYAARLRRIGA